MSTPAPGPVRLGVTWWGHASTTVELGGVRVALDPLLAGRLVHLRRRTPLPPADAALADVVLVSHLHLDHCHLPSLRRFAADVPVVVPRGGERLLADLGDRLLGVGPGETHRVGGVDVEVLAATHDGRRHPWARERPPALGFRVTGPATGATTGATSGATAPAPASFWFPGDTGLREDMREVAPVDLALAPVGGWGPSLGEEHMDPDEAAEAVRRVGARWAVPVHWGTFWPVGLERVDRATHHRLFVTPGQRFADALARAGSARPVLASPAERIVL